MSFCFGVSPPAGTVNTGNFQNTNPGLDTWGEILSSLPEEAANKKCTYKVCLQYNVICPFPVAVLLSH